MSTYWRVRVKGFRGQRTFWASERIEFSSMLIKFVECKPDGDDYGETLRVTYAARTDIVNERSAVMDRKYGTLKVSG